MTTNIAWQRGGRERVWNTYAALHADKIGAHWLWIAIERIVAGEREEEVMRDYGYMPTREAAP